MRTDYDAVFLYIHCAVAIIPVYPCTCFAPLSAVINFVPPGDPIVRVNRRAICLGVLHPCGLSIISAPTRYDTATTVCFSSPARPPACLPLNGPPALRCRVLLVSPHRAVPRHRRLFWEPGTLTSTSRVWSWTSVIREPWTAPERRPTEGERKEYVYSCAFVFFYSTNLSGGGLASVDVERS